MPNLICFLKENILLNNIFFQFEGGWGMSVFFLVSMCRQKIGRTRGVNVNRPFLLISEILSPMHILRSNELHKRKTSLDQSQFKIRASQGHRGSCPAAAFA